MYENFYGLKEKPFSILPDPQYIYWSQSHELALAMLEYGLLNRVGFTVITGEVGCGKTTLLRYLLNELDEDIVVGLMTNPPLDGADLLEWILLAFGEPVDGKSPARLYDDFQKFVIERYKAGGRVLLIVDEAQNLDPQSLEHLRMLSNINAEKDSLFQLILVGQPQLKEQLRQPEMAQFAQRVGADFHLRALDLDDAMRYVAHRLAIAGGVKPYCFTFEAVRLIHEKSRGVPRLINIICDTSMVYGFARQVPVINADAVREVIDDKMEHGVFDFENATAESVVSRALDAAEPLPAQRKPPAGPARGHRSRNRPTFGESAPSSEYRRGQSS